MKVFAFAVAAWFALMSLLAVGDAQAADSLLVLRSEPGDVLGQGQTLAFTTSQGSFTTLSQPHSGLRVRFQGPGHSWIISAERGRSRAFVPGIYGPARTSSADGDTVPMLEIDGDGRGCTDDPGYFDVRSITYDGNGVARGLRVFFEHHCSGATAALRGELRINADTTLTVSAPLRVRARRGQAVALPIGALHAAGLPFSLSALSLPPGAAFVDNGNGTGQMNWTPEIAQQGDFEVAFMANDGLGRTDVAHTLVRVDGDTLLDVTSEPGDRAWLQQNCRWRPGDAMVTSFGSGQNLGVTFVPIHPPGGYRAFSITPVRRGNYSVLRRWSDESYASGKFIASPAPGGCGAVETHYRVRRVEIGPASFTALWAEWEQHCDGESPAFRGELRLNAGSPIVVSAPIARRVHYGDTLRFQVSGRDTLQRPLTLSALTLPAGCTFTPTSSTTCDVSWCPSDAAAGPHTLVFRAVNVAGEADTVATDVVVTGEVSASIVSERGDPEGAGLTVNYDGRPGALLTASLASDATWGTIDAVNYYEPNRAWSFNLRAPLGVPAPPTPVGRYSLIWLPVTSGVQFSGLATLGVHGEQRTADFRVRLMERGASGNPKRFWLQFEQRSDDRTPTLSGDIRVDVLWRVLAKAPLRRAGTVLQPLDFEVIGETPDGEVPSLSSVSMPAGALFSPTTPGRAAFHWVPGDANVGVPWTVGFVASRLDGTTDTTWTILEALPYGSLHMEGAGHAWDLTSDLGQFRTQGRATSARATFSSLHADTLWWVEVGTGSSDSLRLQSYHMVGQSGPSLCVAGPTNSFGMCYADTGRFDVTRLVRTALGPPSQLAVDFDEGDFDPLSRRWGRVWVGSATVLQSPDRHSLPTALECSQFMPNPASRGRRLELRVPHTGRVAMRVFDISGRKVREHEWGVLDAGQHSLSPPGLDTLPPGLYQVRIEYGEQAVMRRLAVLR